MTCTPTIRLAGAALVTAHCSALTAGCAGTAADVRTPVFSVEVERTPETPSDTGGATPSPQPAPSSTGHSISTATTQDNAVTYKISNVQGNVWIALAPPLTEEVRAPLTDESGRESADIADPLRSEICRFEGFPQEANHDGAAWHIACGHKLSDVEMAALRDEDLE